jgi:uncharacterized tellurite resistance protein B-like protein
MGNDQTILEGSSDMEKGAYLGAIASIATADRSATPEEIEYIAALCDSAQVSDHQKQTILAAANEISDEDVKKCLDVLKTSELRFSLITDLMAFAKSDGTYADAEQVNIKKMAQYLGVDEKQYSVLDEFVQKASASPTAPEEVAKPDFLSSLGLKDKMQSAGINGNSLWKGLLGIAGPLILGKMLTGGFNRNRGSYSGGGMFGGGGGMFGGGGGMFGGSGGVFGGGGLGSVISMINGGRGISSTGGLFSRIFRGGF